MKARMALNRHGFNPTHSLGQNFIFDENLIERILDAADVGPGMNVLEIGPGAGVMTALMAARGARVLAIEIDRSLEPVLGEMLAEYPNARVVFDDVMKADVASYARAHFKDGRFRVVANLPYYITTDILSRILRANLPVDSIAVMVQKEAAERVMAAPGDKAYCALAATVQFFGRPSLRMRIPPDAFTPRPHVDSALLRIDLYAEKPVRVMDEKLMLRLIDASFAMRRKTLQNNLVASFSLSRERAARAIELANLPARVRGEALTLAQLGALCDVLSQTQL